MCAFLLLAGSVRANTVADFSQGATPQLLPSTINVNGIKATGMYFNGSKWVTTNLWRRNEIDDRGIGVCSPDDFSAGACPNSTRYISGGGDNNELDNNHYAELIMLTLPSNTKWVSVQLSSLDNNGLTNSSLYEHGQLWAASSSNASLVGTASDTLLWQFAGGGSTEEPIFLIPAAYANSPYLFFRPYDWANPSSKNNDFLVYQATVAPTPIPEPSTLVLLATAGLLGYLVYGRRS
jgi:hypothetical protein